MSELALSTKRSTKCGEEKPLSEFYRDKNRRDGRTPSCGECQRTYQREHQAKVRAEIGEKEWRARRNKIVQRHRAKTEGRPLYNQAYAAATSRLRELHRSDFKRLLNEERYARGLDPI